VLEGSGWFVKEVEVDMPTKGKHYFFKCDSWLAKDKGDGQTSRVFTLDEGEASVVSYKPRQFTLDFRRFLFNFKDHSWLSTVSKGYKSYSRIAD